MRRLSLPVSLILLTNAAFHAAVTAAPAASQVPATAEEASEKFFAVTLRTSLTPISDKQARRDIPERPVYLIQTRAFGNVVYNVRVGFFASFDEAIAYRNGIRAKYPAATVSEIGRNEYSSILRSFPDFKLAAPKPLAEPPAAEPVPAPEPTEPAPVPAIAARTYSSKALYAILLEEKARAITSVDKPLPESLQGYRLYSTSTTVKDQIRFQLKLGFFEKETEVFAAQKVLKRTYPSARVIRVPIAEQAASVQTALRPAPASAVAAPAVPIPTPAVPVPKPVLAAPKTPPAVPGATAAPATAGDRDAFKLMEKARAELARGDNGTAVATLDQLLRLPPNQYSQDAQEYIGLARQRAGDNNAARFEYELYLRLYPTGEGSDRVRQRLAALDASLATAPSPVLKAPKPRVDVLSTVMGSLSQNYYYGASKIDTTEQLPTAGTQNQATLTQTDQKALVTNLNLTHRYRSETYDNRFVIRDTHTKNFLPDQEDRNRLSALYYEVKHRKHDYSARFGRQPGSSGGVLGRFDGVLAGYNISPKWRLNVVGGEPVDVSFNSDVSFYGTSVDLGPFADHWGGSLYTMQQKVDGVVDRNAVGSEIRYFSPVASVYGLYDYDTEFKEPNITLLQGNWSSGTGTSVHVLFDKRKTPSLTLTNSLLGETDTSIRSQLTTRTYEELKQQALDLTSTTTLKSAGVSRSLGTHWQAGLDVQSIHTSATVGTVSQPPQPDSGTIYTYTGNLIGTGLFSPRDVSVISLGRIDGPTYDGNTFSVTNRLLWGTSWSLDTTLSWYRQEDTATDTKLRRFSPVIRPAYKWKENITFEAEFGEERTTTETPTTRDETTRRYWSLGYRWDF